MTKITLLPTWGLLQGWLDVVSMGILSLLCFCLGWTLIAGLFIVNLYFHFFILHQFQACSYKIPALQQALTLAASLNQTSTMRLYSYVIPSDTGLAPNPFWGRLTLAVCKPDIRKVAEINDWVIGVGSNNVDRKDKAYVDYSNKLVFAMQVSDIMTMKEYDEYCSFSDTEIKNKIPNDKSWKHKVGDCIYKFPINGNSPLLRQSLHNERNRKPDLNGKYVLLSDNFFYFGSNAKPIDKKYNSIIKKGRKHLVVEDELLIKDFEKWLMTLGFDKNNLSEPQLKGDIDKVYCDFENANCVDKKSTKQLDKKPAANRGFVQVGLDVKC